MQFFYINNFIKFIFNKYYYIYMKSFSSTKVIYWTLFSYTVDKYYISINKTLKNQQSYFLKYNTLIFLNKNVYINNLIKFKKKNSSFKTYENLRKFLLNEFYRYNHKTPINFISTNISQLIFEYSNQKKTTLYTNKHKNYFLINNPFSFKIKSLISKNRKLLTELLNFKLRRQYRITRFLVNFIKFKVKKSFNFFEFTLSNILLISKLVFNLKHSYEYIKRNFVYVNGFKNLNPNFFLKKSDKIQLILSTQYYDNYTYQFNELLKSSLKYHNKFFKNSTINIYRFKKQKISNLILTLSSFKKGIPRYIEVDFTTLSVIILFKPNSYFFINHYPLYVYNFYLNRLYNWKFIT